MAGESAKSAGHDQADSLIDELIREILNEPGRSPESAPGGPSPAALLETAFASTMASSKISPLERLLIAEAFGSALAEALAPALAEQLTPRLMKHLDQAMVGRSAGKSPAGAASASGSGRESKARESQQPGR
jgi:hypothetical protein